MAFAFSYILNAERFLMLGGYDYYFLTQHAETRTSPLICPGPPRPRKP